MFAETVDRTHSGMANTNADRDAPTYAWTLFECTAQEKVDYTCPDPIKGTLPANYKYRAYETIVPLRNPMWNR